MTICKIPLEELPDSLKVGKGIAILGKPSFDARGEENNRKSLDLKNKTIKEIKNIKKNIEEIIIEFFK